MEGKVNPSEMKRRSALLGELSNNLHAEFFKQHLGTRQSVLFESTRKAGLMLGFTGNYIKVAIPYDKDLVGKIVEVELMELNHEGFVNGKIC